MNTSQTHGWIAHTVLVILDRLSTLHILRVAGYFVLSIQAIIVTWLWPQLFPARKKRKLGPRRRVHMKSRGCNRDSSPRSSVVSANRPPSHGSSYFVSRAKNSSSGHNSFTKSIPNTNISLERRSHSRGAFCSSINELESSMQYMDRLEAMAEQQGSEGQDIEGEVTATELIVGPPGLVQVQWWGRCGLIRPVVLVTLALLEVTLLWGHFFHPFGASGTGLIESLKDEYLTEIGGLLEAGEIVARGTSKGGVGTVVKGEGVRFAMRNQVVGEGGGGRSADDKLEGKQVDLAMEEKAAIVKAVEVGEDMTKPVPSSTAALEAATLHQGDQMQAEEVLRWGETELQLSIGGDLILRDSGKALWAVRGSKKRGNILSRLWARGRKRAAGEGGRDGGGAGVVAGRTNREKRFGGEEWSAVPCALCVLLVTGEGYVELWDEEEGSLLWSSKEDVGNRCIVKFATRMLKRWLGGESSKGKKEGGAEEGPSSTTIDDDSSASPQQLEGEVLKDHSYSLVVVNNNLELRCVNGTVKWSPLPR